VIPTATEATLLTNYINGKWTSPESAAMLEVRNPATNELLAHVPLSGADQIDAAAHAARAAFDDWSRTPVATRCQPLFRLAARLREQADDIARMLTREMGKSLGDAAAELKRAIENVEVACGMPTLMQGQNVTGCASEIDGEVLCVPVGVFGIISPFNFPLMVPLWFLPYAIGSGNTVVLKCSEQVPMSMQRAFELIDEVGFPPGVVNLVHGDKTAAEALVNHEKIDGISFVGSSTIAQQVAESCAKQGKRCQALGSAKNYLVVMPDAPREQVVANMLTSCLGCAGQRCMAASAIACVGDETYDDIVERFVAAAREAVVGDPLDPNLAATDLVIGPVISAKAKQRIESLIQTGTDEGARVLVDGRNCRVAGAEHGHFVGATVFADVKPGSTLETTEIFGPVVIIMKFDSLDEAIDSINRHRFGNGASIYTQDGYNARKFKLETKAGMIGINVGIPAPVAYLPFGGMKKSIFADIKAQSREVVSFFTEKKIITQRYWPSAPGN